MQVCVVDSKKIELSKSLLAEDYNLSGIDSELTTGVVALNSEMQVLPLISHYLTRELANNHISVATARTYGKNLNYLLAYLKTLRSLKYEQLDQAFLSVQKHHIQEYLAYLKMEVGLSSKTIRNRDASYKAFFDRYLCTTFSNQDELRVDNPYDDGLLSGVPTSSLVEMCQLNELISLINNTDSERERCLIQFMYDSGLRRSEVPRITKAHIDKAYNTDRKSFIADDKTILVPSKYKLLFIPGSKGRNREIKPRYTLVSESTLIRVKKYHATPLYKKNSRKFGEDKPAFLNAHGRAFTSSSVSKLFERVSRRALKNRHIESAIPPHKLRHGFAGSFLRSPDIGDNDVDRLVALQRCLGHSKLSTTEVYTSVPYDILGNLMDSKGEKKFRHQIMESVAVQTKKAIKLGDKK
ncbi:site-specific integrase [Vibrio parahaemolyticus]|uniref:tyrosine-type recombinase/integrase n=1 Tax=Vibrio parahaemolyticus TaxID=670 RepID=UPI00215D477D|nr:site-specific integrase [Vibrio parahaemolyticus]MCR9712327.1 site-specific integrase [Vibrio parahaemolyticus]